MSTSDGEGLRAAIREQPDDDTLRLIYADWLQENDQADRGAFVRAQVLAGQAEPFSPQEREQAKIAKQLLEQHPEWGRPLRQWANSWRFARGMVDHVQVNAAQFPRDAAALFAAEPIRSLQLMRYASPSGVVSLGPFFQLPELDRVQRLDLNHMQLSTKEFELLAETPELINLTDLCLRQNVVMPDWLGELLTGLAMPELVGLDLFDLSHLGPRLVDVLPRIARRFSRLNLGKIRFMSDQMTAVLQSRSLREVEELRLEWFAGAGAGALAHVSLGWVIPWNRLRLLDLNGQGIGDNGVTEIVRELTRRKEPAPLRWLGLANNGIGPEGIAELIRSDPERVRLYHLDVEGNTLSLSQRGALQTRFREATIRF